MPLNLKSVANGSVILTPASTVTDKTITLPATDGTMVVQDGTNTTTINNLAYTGTLTGGTGVINIGSGQVYKDASGNVGIGTSSPPSRLSVSGGSLSVAGSTAGSGVVKLGDPTESFPYVGMYRSAAATIGTSGNFLNLGGYDGIAFTTGNTQFSGQSEHMRIASSGFVGIGVITPSQKLTVAGSVQINDSGTLYLNNADNTNQYYWQNAGSSGANNATLILSRTNAGETLRVNSLGYLGIATLNPIGRLHPGGTSAQFVQAVLTNGVSDPNFQLYVLSGDSGATSNIRQASIRLAYTGTGYGPGISFLRGGGATDGSLVFETSGVEKARIDSSGRLLVGATSIQGDGRIAAKGIGGSYAAYASEVDTTSGVFQFTFHNPNGLVGSISSGGSATSYNTSSDYRLKENVAPMTGALAKVAQLKPCTYTWKVDGSAGQGFIAHELQEVVPDCVTGEKDAVDEDGKPKYQGVDTSFLVATLVAAIQELTARLEVLENK